MSDVTIRKKWEAWKQFFTLLEQEELFLLHLIEKGKELPKFSSCHYQEENLVKGCMSRLWLVVAHKKGIIYIQGRGESLILTGLLALVIDLFSAQSAVDILNFPIHFWEKSFLEKLISSRRLVGFQHLIQKIYQVASQVSSKKD